MADRGPWAPPDAGDCGCTCKVVAIVVYESLWGNTAAIAHAIADGLGPGTRIGSTGDISPAVAATAALLVVGAPVHAMSLPTTRSLTSVARRTLGDGEIAGDVDHPLMRDWIIELRFRESFAAAFDTRVTGLMGRGGTNALERLLKGTGRRLIDQSGRYIVDHQREVRTTAGMLREGELGRARAWGEHLATLDWKSPNLQE